MATINPSNQQITNHSVLVGAASNLVTNLAVASTGQVLTGNTGADPSWASPSSVGTWVYLGQQNASSSSTISFTTGISSTYNTYKVVYSNVSAVTNAVNFICRISIDGGSSYIATNYFSGYRMGIYNSATFGNANTTTSFILAGTFTNTATDTGAGEVIFYDFSSGARTKMCASGTLINTSNPYYGLATGSNTNTTQVNAVQFLMTSGNILTGKFTLYGLVES